MKSAPYQAVENNILATLLVCSFRQAIGRYIYKIEEVTDALLEFHKVLAPEEKQAMVKEIDRRWAADALGSDEDSALWLEVREKLDK